MRQPGDKSRRGFLKESSMLALAAALSPVTIADAFADSKFECSQKEPAMTQTSATQITDKTAIRPFQFNFPEAELTELRRRIKATRWPEREVVTDTSQGVQLATMQKLAQYWGTDYDWRKVEAKLKALPHFITEINGLDIQTVSLGRKSGGKPTFLTLRLLNLLD